MYVMNMVGIVVQCECSVMQEWVKVFLWSIFLVVVFFFLLFGLVYVIGMGMIIGIGGVVVVQICIINVVFGW